jgi:DNA-binding response OmpR family regulator
MTDDAFTMAAGSSELSLPSQPTTVLIVEDDVLPAMALRDAFEEAGYHVLELTGRHGVALSAARAGKPDMALVNIELQGRDDGLALAQDLKAMGIPSLLISGQVSRAASERTAAVGSFPKPYRGTDVVEAVAYLLGHLKGAEVGEPPKGLEVFDPAPPDEPRGSPAADSAHDRGGVVAPQGQAVEIPEPQVVSPPQKPGEAKVPEIPAEPPG